MEIGRKLLEITSEIEKIKKEDVSYSNLGEQNNFVLADELIKKYINIIEDVVQSIKENYEQNEYLFIYNIVDVLLSFIKTLNSFINQIRTLVQSDGKGIYNGNFPNQREGIIKAIKIFENTIKSQLQPQFLTNKIIQLSKTIPQDKSKYETYLKDIESLSNEYNAKAKNIDKILNKLQDISLEETVKKSKLHFEHLAKNHGKNQKAWFISAVLSLIWLGITIYYYIVPSVPPEINKENSEFYFYIILPFILKRIFQILIPLLVLKVSLNKYNAERNLKIIYDHRETALDLYYDFENSIGENTEAKDTLRLEITKLLFHDPATGYIHNSSDSDFNINPVVNMIDSLKKTKES